MASTIQVILQQDLANLGKSGELVKVRPGYARNFLLPRELAVPATARNITRIEHDQREAAVRAEKAKAEAVALAGKISAIPLIIERKVGEEDRLFGSVTAKDIHAALTAKGVEVDRKKIVLAEPIRQLGSYEVTLKLLNETVATLKIEVKKMGG